MKKLSIFFKEIRTILREFIYETKAECSFNIPDISSFSKEQKIAFDQLIDFLANMLEKYNSQLDEIVTNKTNENTIKQAV